MAEHGSMEVEQRQKPPGGGTWGLLEVRKPLMTLTSQSFSLLERKKGTTGFWLKNNLHQPLT
jgi:hypothetical protein